MILGVFNLKSDIGAKRAADVTYIHVTFGVDPTADAPPIYSLEILA